MLQFLRSLNLLKLPLNVPFVFHLELNRLHDIRITNISSPEHRGNFFVCEVLTPENLSQRLRWSDSGSPALGRWA